MYTSSQKQRGFLICALALLIITISVTFTACDGNANRANILPPEVQYMADTMFSHKRRALINEMDSICSQELEVLIANARDSIVALEEIHIKKITGNE